MRTGFWDWRSFVLGREPHGRRYAGLRFNGIFLSGLNVAHDCLWILAAQHQHYLGEGCPRLEMCRREGSSELMRVARKSQTVCLGYTPPRKK
jgi:hypothetical protein